MGLSASVFDEFLFNSNRLSNTQGDAIDLIPMPAYIMRGYRFLTDPTIKKGKVHSVIALHKAGRSPDEIKAATRSPAKSIKGYVEAFEVGRGLGSFNGFRGKALKTADLCQLHGAWHQAFEV